MPSFSDFDTRGYRTVDVRTGYARWVETYDRTVPDGMDLGLLDELREPDWTAARRVADLGCGTGRTAAWLRERGAGAIDGVDVTPEMLERARARGLHQRLLEADVAHTGLDADAYDLVIASLVDDHVAELGPLYSEARRLAKPGAPFVLVGFHPHFIMASGIPTHFTDADGEDIAISTHVHLVSEQVAAAHAAGWRLAELREAVVDERWVERKPRWESLRGHPVSIAYVWR